MLSIALGVTIISNYHIVVLTTTTPLALLFYRLTHFVGAQRYTRLTLSPIDPEERPWTKYSS